VNETIRFELADCTGTLLREIACPDCKRNDVALAYCLAMQSSEPTDWKAVNAAILKRWSPAGLLYIKKRAWKLCEGKVRP
jgi:hypothetical protein